jgi:MraZ protein
VFTGEYQHNIDPKGRLIIPSRFRDELSEDFIITRGLDGCLFVYTKSVFNKIVTKLRKKPFTKKKNRDFQRFFLSGAIECSLDKQGRASISKALVKYAGLDKECVVTGVNERLEIWSKDAWDSFFEENLDAFSDIAEEVFDLDLDMEL